jgi:hypothetical protein
MKLKISLTTTRQEPDNNKFDKNASRRNNIHKSYSTQQPKTQLSFLFQPLEIFKNNSSKTTNLKFKINVNIDQLLEKYS